MPTPAGKRFLSSDWSRPIRQATATHSSLSDGSWSPTHRACLTCCNGRLTDTREAAELLRDVSSGQTRIFAVTVDTVLSTGRENHGLNTGFRQKSSRARIGPLPQRVNSVPIQSPCLHLPGGLQIIP